jgi:hypothetical protein
MSPFICMSTILVHTNLQKKVYKEFCGKYDEKPYLSRLEQKIPLLHA